MQYLLQDQETFRAFLTATSGIIIAMLGYLGVQQVRIRRHTRATRYQVENDHETNLRVEADERDASNKASFAQILDALNALRRDFGGMREEVRQLRRHDETADERLLQLERTLPKAPAQPRRRNNGH